MKTRYKIALTIGVGALGAYTGYITGLALHDLLAYIIPLGEFSKFSWFDPKEYVALYNHYSYGLDKLFGKVFGLVGGSLGAYFGYKVGSV